MRGTVRKSFAEQRNEVLRLKGLVGHSPDGQGWLAGKRPRCGSVGRLEPMRAFRKALRPADRAQAILRSLERSAIGAQPGIRDHVIALEAVELERAENGVVELPENLFEGAVRIRLGDPAEPRRGGPVFRESVTETRLTQRRGPVGADDPLDAIRVTNGQANTCWSAKVVHDERDVSQVKIQDEPLQVVDVVLKEIVPVLGRLAFSEAHMVGCDHSMPRRKGLDEVPKQVSPGWLAVKGQNGLTLALVHVVHPKARRLGVAGFERPRAVEGLVHG